MRRFAPRRKGSPTTNPTALRPRRYCATWRRCVRGEVFRLHAPRGSRGHEQYGSRYAVVVQSDHVPLSTWLVAPTSTSARAASFRPEVEIAGVNTRVLAEQTAAVDPGRLGKSVGFLSFDEMRRVDAALRVVLGL
nr:MULTISPECIES: type II toxin-antitoxin system PemK/MazF family toxin [Mycobacterium]